MREGFIALAILVILGGCSSKESFAPEHTQGPWPNSTTLTVTEDIFAEQPTEDTWVEPCSPHVEYEPIIFVPKPAPAIADVGYAGAMLENGQIITTSGLQRMRFDEAYRFLSANEGRMLGASIDGHLKVIDTNDGNATTVLDLKKSIAGASLQGEILAVLFTDNGMALYEFPSGMPLMKESGTPPLALDTRIVNPYFFNDLVLFPTLDGKIVIIHGGQKQVLRSIIVSSTEQFNNIIYFKPLGNTIIAATPTTLFALADREVREPYDLRDVVFEEDNVWIATKQGEVMVLTPSLQLKAKQKFPFAHFLGMIVTEEKVLLLEKEGYLIALDKALTQYEIYEIDHTDGFVFAGERAFYFDTERLAVP